MNINFFDKNAHTYTKSSFLQKDIARELISNIPDNSTFDEVLDLGAGTGNVYSILEKKFDINFFTAQDKSENMLNLHKNNSNIRKILSDFSENKNYDRNYDLIISSASLQWDKNLKDTFEKIAMHTSNIYLAIITSNSLKAIFKEPLNGFRDEESINKLAREIFANFDIYLYTKKIEFELESKSKVLEYIRDTGISGDIRKSWQERKNILKSMDTKIDYEIVFIKCTKGK